MPQFHYNVDANQLTPDLKTILLVVQSSRAISFTVNTNTLPVIQLAAWLTELTIATVILSSS